MVRRWVLVRFSSLHFLFSPCRVHPRPACFADLGRSYFLPRTACARYSPSHLQNGKNAHIPQCQKYAQTQPSVHPEWPRSDRIANFSELNSNPFMWISEIFPWAVQIKCWICSGRKYTIVGLWIVFHRAASGCITVIFFLLVVLTWERLARLDDHDGTWSVDDS